MKNAGSPSPLTPASSCRYDSSLGKYEIHFFVFDIHCFDIALKLSREIIVTRLSWPGLLTKKFINLIKHAEDGILDLNKAAETLEVIIFLSEHIHFWIQ